jgi:hypothetical protein
MKDWKECVAFNLDDGTMQCAECYVDGGGDGTGIDDDDMYDDKNDLLVNPDGYDVYQVCDSCFEEFDYTAEQVMQDRAAGTMPKATIVKLAKFARNRWPDLLNLGSWLLEEAAKEGICAETKKLCKRDEKRIAHSLLFELGAYKQ